MPYCWEKNTEWLIENLRVGTDFRQYTVQLNRQIGCCCEAYRLYVNNQEIVGHTLKYNPFSPACCDGGQFEFEQDGHTFLIMYNTYSWMKKFGEFRLFIDGTDVNSGLEYSAFWRRRGWQIVVLGAFFLSLAVVFSMSFAFLLPRSWRVLRLGRIATPAFVVVAIIYFIIGITVMLRHRRPRNPGAALVEYQPRTV